MKTVGEILQAARKKKGWKIEDLSRRIKVQPRFLRAIEKADFKRLPEAPFVKGFIRAEAAELGLNPDELVAIFRRDFGTDQGGKIVPIKLEGRLREGWRWSPRLTLAAGVGVVVVGFMTYLTFHLGWLVRSPELTVDYPREGEIVTENVLVEGRTEPGVVVRINGQEVKRNKDGVFSQTILLTEGLHTVTVEAAGQNGKRTTMQRTVQVKLKE